MNKNGFTLVELLAVIVLLSIIMTLGIVGVGAIKTRINDNMFTSKLDYILTAAKTWGGDHKEQIGSNTYIKVGALIAAKYLKTDEKDASNNSAVIYDNDKTSINNLNVKVYIENTRVYACINKNNAKTTYSNIPWDKFDSKKYYCD